MRIAGSFALLAFLVVGAAGRADFEARRVEARRALQEDVEAYASWCHANKLFAERKKALELLLELEPGHADAVKALGWTREKDGTWKPPATPKTFRDFDKKALDEAPERWRGATARYVESMVALLDSAELSAEERERAAREALRFDADNERAHARLGDVRVEEGWVLADTASARERRAVLREQVRVALEGAPAAEEVAPSERERAIRSDFKALAAPGLRVVGTVGKDELALTAQAVLALERLLQAVFESKHELPQTTTVFLLSDPRQLPEFLAKHPSIAPEQRPLYERLEGGGIHGTDDFAFWSGDTQRRIDGVVRLALGYWLSGAYEIDVRHGWAYEGFGLFLTRSLVRTRMTWLAQPSATLDPAQDVALRQKLIDPATNWMDEALRLMQEKRQPPLVELFRKSASQLSTEDVLYAYALATYLLEARPAAVAGMLDKLGGGYSAAQGFQETVGMDLASFERHLARWLSERH